MNFIEEIEKEVNQDYIDLRHYVSEHIQKTFINQVKSDLRHEIDAATKVTDPLKVKCKKLLWFSQMVKKLKT